MPERLRSPSRADPITNPAISVAIRPEKVRLARRGPASDAANAHAINRLEGVVTDVSYLGGLTAYKVKLDTGAVVRSSIANTTRLDVDAYQAEPARGGWFTPDDCVVLDAMSTRRIFARPARLAAIAPYLWMLLFFLVPFVLRAEDQPVADRDRAAALSAGIRSRARAGGRSGLRSRRCRSTISAAGLRRSVSLSYLRSLAVAAVSTAILLVIGYPIAYGMARLPRRWQGVRDDAGDRAVLDLVPDPHLCLDQHPAARRAAQPVLLALHLISTPVVLLSTDTAIYLGIVYSYLPFMVLPLYATLEKMDPALLEAATDLGARRGRRSGW